MSLDFYLTLDGKEVFSANVTHNLNKMADLAGIYECLWRPEEHGITHAKQVIEPLQKGIVFLTSEKAACEALNASNGWGTWRDFLPWCCEVLEACKKYPEAEVRVSR